MTLVSLIIRIIIFLNVFYLLAMTSFYPESYPLSLLNWWIYYLIFDIWLLNNIKILDDNKKDE
jgi:hypothetical protein